MEKITYSEYYAVSSVEPVLSGPVLSGHPLLKRSVVKVPKITSLNYCSFDLYQAVTAIKRSRSPFTKSRRAVSIILTCIKRHLAILNCGNPSNRH